MHDAAPETVFSEIVFAEGWSKATTGHAPVDEASCSNLLMSKPFSRGALRLDLTCIYQILEALQA